MGYIAYWKDQLGRKTIGPKNRTFREIRDWWQPNPCGLEGCKNRACSVTWPVVVKDVPNQSVASSVSEGSFSLYLLCSGCTKCFVSLFLVVSASAVNCLERIVSKMTYYVSNGTLNPTHPLAGGNPIARWCAYIWITVVMLLC